MGLQMQATMHSRDSMCTIIPHFMDKAQKAAEIFQVEENSSSQINKSESIIINNILIQGFTRVQLSWTLERTISAYSEANIKGYIHKVQLSIFGEIIIFLYFCMAAKVDST